MKKIQKHTIVIMGIVLNVIGAYIAMTFKIPFYMDSIGTIFVAGILGFKYAIIAGILGSLVSGMTFDIYSLYYAPVQIFTGFFAGILYDTKWLNGKRMVLGNLLVAIPTSLASAIITAVLFNGITSSGSTFLVIILNKLKFNLVTSILLVQIFTDYIDKLLAVIISKIFIERLHFKIDVRGKNETIQ